MIVSEARQVSGWILVCLLGFTVQTTVCKAETVHLRGGKKADAKVVEHNRNSMIYTQKAIEALGESDVETGIALLEKALALNPNNHVALGTLAGVYANFKHDFPKSNELFKKSLAIKEDFDVAHFGLGVNYASMGMKSEAKKEFETTLRVTDKQHMKDSAKKALLMLEQQP